MNINDFDYDLPEHFIAQTPLDKRDHSKILIYNRDTGKHEITQFFNIIDHLRDGDVLVVNNTKVIPARLFGVKEKTGAKIELLLLRKLEIDTYSALIKPLKRLSVGEKVVLSDTLAVELISKDEEQGTATIRFNTQDVEGALSELGEMPLPHYITKKLTDRDRYQTVYAKSQGSVAAPTAGLHWTPELMDKARAKGVIFAEVVLHVGLGTFRPVKVDDITKHDMHSEWYDIPQQSLDVIKKAKAEKRRVICVGTTSMRTMEAYAKTGEVRGDTDIFIYPPYNFGIADGLITNFHLPKSTLVMLVSAFMGREKTLEMYEIAKQNDFRFFSFGDCMLIV